MYGLSSTGHIEYNLILQQTLTGLSKPIVWNEIATNGLHEIGDFTRYKTNNELIVYPLLIVLEAEADGSKVFLDVQKDVLQLILD